MEPVADEPEVDAAPGAPAPAPSSPDPVTFHIVEPTSDDAVEAMHAYFAELDARFVGGFDPGDSLTVGVHSMREPNGGTFVVARVGDTLAACGGVQRHDANTGEIKRMWVNPNCRGIGLGRRMLAELEAQVARLGYTNIVLDTNDVLTEAIALYTRSGYREIPPYNDNPFARHWFAKTRPPSSPSENDQPCRVAEGAGSGSEHPALPPGRQESRSHGGVRRSL
jgi:GNAT superfamily N-acetyltransferase